MTRQAIAPSRPAVAGSSSLRVEWHENLQAIERLREPWTALEQRTRNRSAFARWLYRRVWYRNFAAHGEQPLCGTAWDGERLVGVAAMARSRGRLGGVPVVRVDFSGRQGYQGEFLVDDEHRGAAAVLFASLLREHRPDAGTLIGPPIGSPEIDALSRVAREQGFKLLADEHHEPIVDISSGYDAYFASMKPNFRRNVRSRERKLEQIGAVAETFGTRGEDAEAAHAAAMRLVAIADNSWRATEEGPMPELWRAIYADTAETFAAEGNLRLEFLVIDGKDAAFFLALADGDRVYDIAVGFRQEFKSLSPGTVLMQRALRGYCAEGVRTVVSQGPYPYKRHWSTGQLDCSRVRFFGPSLRGRLSHLGATRLLPLVEGLRTRRSRWHGSERK